MAKARKTRGKRSTRKRPNIIVFMMDTQGTFNMTCYGYRRPTTPHIDRLAREGTLFERHFVTSPWTLPVHASLFTGRYESGHGAGAQHEGLEPGLPSLPEVLTRSGYRTVGICNNGWALRDDAWNPGVGFEDHLRYGPNAPKDPAFHHDPALGNDSASLAMVGVAKEWIEKNVLGRSKPFFMFLNNTAPHDPYAPPEPFRSRFLSSDVTFEEAFARKGGQAVSTIGKRALTFQEWQWQRELYDGETACLDDRIGTFYGVLADMGILDDTLFIVTGDHGDSLGQHVGAAYHTQNAVYDAIVQTPLVCRLPGAFPRGKRCKELVQINDVFPTILEMLGIEDKRVHESMQGESLLAALKGPVRDFALVEAQTPIHPMRRAWQEDPDCDVRFMGAALKAARTKRYKYIWHAYGSDMLFDVVNDPDERWNLMDSKPEVARKLRRQMEAKLMSMEQRYYPDMFRPGNARDALAVRRLCAWGLFRPGIVPPWDPDNVPDSF